nr:MAG TPA: hypothetical protein [Caudoviricetes sp.]
MKLKTKMEKVCMIVCGMKLIARCRNGMTVLKKQLRNIKKEDGVNSPSFLIPFDNFSILFFLIYRIFTDTNGICLIVGYLKVKPLFYF